MEHRVLGVDPCTRAGTPRSDLGVTWPGGKAGRIPWEKRNSGPQSFNKKNEKGLVKGRVIATGRGGGGGTWSSRSMMGRYWPSKKDIQKLG